MLTFFRRIRKGLLDGGKTSRYLLYAIGEIALVVIGILIALQINNWNETRKLLIGEQQLFSKILSDLQSDSILIANTLTYFKKSQDLYYHLYYETKGKAYYDSTLEYGRLRFAPSFNALVKNNYQQIVDNIINEKVRNSLSAYFQTEENVRTLGVGQFMNLQVDFVRPFLTASNISDLDTLYSLPRYANNDPNKMISYQALKAQFHTAEFAHVLYELRVKAAASIQSLRGLEEANIKLQETIRQAMKSKTRS